MALEVDLSDPDDALFTAIAWADRPGIAGDQTPNIEAAIAAGADIDGLSQDGQTPLTAAIEGGMGAPAAVSALLSSGANPSKRDDQGWTPWGICHARSSDRVVREQMAAIRALLQDAGADTKDEALLDFQTAIATGDEAKVNAMLDADIDLAAPFIDPVYAAVGANQLALIERLLGHGANAEGNDRDPDATSPLVHAAQEGNLAAVKLLVHAGADPNRYAYDDPQCTAAFLAREAGHAEVADWLSAQLPQAVQVHQQARIAARDPKYTEVYEHRTSAPNYELSTDDVVAQLAAWDHQYAVSISEVDGASLVVTFAHLPDDVTMLAEEIYEFCPDIVDQHFGCMDDMVEHMQQSGQAIPPDVGELVKDIDFENPNFGLEILARSLRKTHRIVLWWD